MLSEQEVRDVFCTVEVMSYHYSRLTPLAAVRMVSWVDSVGRQYMLFCILRARAKHSVPNTNDAAIYPNIYLGEKTQTHYFRVVFARTKRLDFVDNSRKQCAFIARAMYVQV